MTERTVPKEFNDANIRVAREFKAERDDLLKANQILQALIGNRDKEVDRLRSALLKIEQETINDIAVGIARAALSLTPTHSQSGGSK